MIDMISPDRRSRYAGPLMQMHRDRGVHINNPHVYVVEDGKQGKPNPAVLAKKVEFDPQGLLNPGKLRAWDLREVA